MNECDVLDCLLDYGRKAFLGGSEGFSLTPESELLDSAVLKSIEMTQLLRFIRDNFDVQVPPREITRNNFRNMQSIASLVTSLRAASAR